MPLNTLEKDDLLRRIAWLNSEVDKIKRMLSGQPIGTARISDASITNAKIADASITNAKIVDLTWDKAQGGTATLGGVANGDGILTVKDGLNNQIVVVDKEGILINGGKVTIKDENNVSILDSKGLISSNSFDGNIAVGTALQSTTSTVYIDATGLSLTINVIREGYYLFFASLNGACSRSDTDGNGSCAAILNIDGTNISNPIFMPGREFSGGTDATSGALIELILIPEGSHIIKIMFKSNTGANVTLFKNQSKLSYIKLGN